MVRRRAQIIDKFICLFHGGMTRPRHPRPDCYKPDSLQIGINPDFRANNPFSNLDEAEVAVHDEEAAGRRHPKVVN